MKGSRSNYLSGFDPKQIPGCELWLDAADRSSLTLSGSNVTQWRDKSGNGHIFSTFAGTPALSNSVRNGNSALALNGTSSLNNTTLAFPSSAYSVFVIAYLETQGGLGNYRRLINGGGGSADAFLYVGAFTSNYAVFTGTGSSWNDTNAVTPATNIFQQWTLLEATVSGSSLIPYVNGTALTAKTGTTSAFTGLSVGASQGNTTSQGWVGFCGDILVYNSVLSTAQRQQVEGYLARKWGVLSSLPATHPFKSVPPTLRPLAPIDIPGCLLWLDAADAAAMTLSGSNITSVADKSGSGRTLSNVSGFTYNQVKFNGSYPSFYNTGVTGTSLGSNTSFSASQPITAFVVGQPGFGSNTGTFPVLFDSTSASSRIILYYHSSNGYRIKLFAGSEIEYTETSSKPFIHSCIVNATSSSIITDGTTRVSGNVGSGGFSGLRVGNDVNGATSAWNGHICEVLFFSGVLSISNRQQVEGYLARKWGVRLTYAHPYAFGLPALTAGFTPVAIPGCSLWLDAADQTSMTFSSGSNLATWTDKSGSGLVGTAVNAPTFQPGVQNGLPVIRFNGTNQYINFGDVLNLGTNGLTIFMVTRFAINTGGGVGMVGKSSFRSNAGRWWMVFATADFGVNGVGINSFIEDGNQVVAGLAFNPATQMNLFTAVNNRTSTNTLYENGTLGNQRTFTQTATNLGNTDPVYVAAYPNSTGTAPLAGYYMNGDIAEILVYFSALTTAQRQQVEGYLAWKWGLQRNLPAPVVPSGFTPLSLSGCQLWLDAADVSSFTFSSGSNIATWNDKSPNAYTGTAIASPVRTTDSSLPCVSFNGSSQYVNFGDSADLGSNQLYIFAVARFATTGTGTLIAKSRAADAIHRYALLREGSTLFPLLQGNTIGVANNSGITDASTTRRVLTMTWDRTTLQLYENGVPIVLRPFADSSTFNSTYPLVVGAYNDATGGVNPPIMYFNGFIHELVMITAPLTMEQRDQMETYLAGKWSLQGSFAGAHPYRLIKP